MKINEVEALAGISKKNIRFYEEQGLLSPRRNAENGYRDYGDEEVRILRRIRLLRRLGMPIEEIRQMFSGIHTVGDGMRRHMISLEREKRNLEQSMELCRELQNREVPITELETDELLSRMDEMERSGASFLDPVPRDIRAEYRAPVVVTALMVALMSALIGLIVYAVQTAPEEAPPVWVIAILIAVLASVAVGAVMALLQRIREIQKGEMDDARYY